MNYRFSDEAIRQLVRKRIIRVAITYAFMFVIVVLVLVSRGLEPPLAVLAFLALIFAAMIVAGIFKIRKQAASISLTLTDDAISMSLPGLIASEVRRDDVMRIEERREQGIAVHGRDKRVVGVPVMIEGYDDIRTVLATWRPIEPAQPARMELKRTLAVFGVLAGWAATYVFADPRIVIPVGSLLVIALLASLVIIWRNKMLDIRYKRAMLLVLVPVVAVAFRVIEVAAR